MERQPSLVFYDGHCGLCHRAALFALRHDPDGSRFLFAPLQGETIRRELEAESIAGLADSIVLIDAEGRVLQESDAVLWMLNQIGGVWGNLGRVSSWVPRSLRDLVYRAIARIRSRLFKTPPDVCPIVPAELQARFLP